MSRVLWLLRSAHPEPAAAVTVVTALLAAAVGRGAAGIAAAAATVAATQLCLGWVNDWLDADRDAAVGRADKPLPRGNIARPTVGVAGLHAALGVEPAWLSSRVSTALFARTALV